MSILAAFNFGVIVIDGFDDEGDPVVVGFESRCYHCGDEVHTPDDRTGLIHTHGKYTCYQDVVTSGGNVKRVAMETVAELDVLQKLMDEFEEI